MFEAEYTRFKFCRIKHVYFAERLPSPIRYHIVYCHNCYNDLPVRNPFKVERWQTILLDLTQDVDKLFGKIKRQRRQFIRRGENADIQVTARKPSDDLLKEFHKLY